MSNQQQVDVNSESSLSNPSNSTERQQEDVDVNQEQGGDSANPRHRNVHSTGIRDTTHRDVRNQNNIQNDIQNRRFDENFMEEQFNRERLLRLLMICVVFASFYFAYGWVKPMDYYYIQSSENLFKTTLPKKMDPDSASLLKAKEYASRQVQDDGPKYSTPFDKWHERKQSMYRDQFIDRKYADHAEALSRIMRKVDHLSKRIDNFKNTTTNRVAGVISLDDKEVDIQSERNTEEADSDSDSMDNFFSALMDVVQKVHKEQFDDGAKEVLENLKTKYKSPSSKTFLDFAKNLKLDIGNEDEKEWSTHKAKHEKKFMDPIFMDSASASLLINLLDDIDEIVFKWNKSFATIVKDAYYDQTSFIDQDAVKRLLRTFIAVFETSKLIIMSPEFLQTEDIRMNMELDGLTFWVRRLEEYERSTTQMIVESLQDVRADLKHVSQAEYEEALKILETKLKSHPNYKTYKQMYYKYFAGLRRWETFLKYLRLGKIIKEKDYTEQTPKNLVMKDEEKEVTVECTKWMIKLQEHIIAYDKAIDEKSRNRALDEESTGMFTSTGVHIAVVHNDEPRLAVLVKSLKRILHDFGSDLTIPESRDLDTDELLNLNVMTTESFRMALEWLSEAFELPHFIDGLDRLYLQANPISGFYRMVAKEVERDLDLQDMESTVKDITERKDRIKVLEPVIDVVSAQFVVSFFNYINEFGSMLYSKQHAGSMKIMNYAREDFKPTRRLHELHIKVLQLFQTSPIFRKLEEEIKSVFHTFAVDLNQQLSVIQWEVLNLYEEKVEQWAPKALDKSDQSSYQYFLMNNVFGSKRFMAYEDAINAIYQGKGKLVHPQLIKSFLDTGKKKIDNLGTLDDDATHEVRNLHETYVRLFNILENTVDAFEKMEARAYREDDGREFFVLPKPWDMKMFVDEVAAGSVLKYFVKELQDLFIKYRGGDTISNDVVVSKTTNNEQVEMGKRNYMTEKLEMKQTTTSIFSYDYSQDKEKEEEDTPGFTETVTKL